MKRVIGVLGLVGMTLLSAATSVASSEKPAPADSSFFLTAHPAPGTNLSFITYRVISVYGPEIDDTVVTIPATGTYTFLTSDSPDSIHWKADVRMDGKRVIKAVEGEYRDHGTTICYGEKCSFNTNASGPFYNRTFWGSLKGGELKTGETWTLALTKPWELGPPGTQAVTVVSIDKANGVTVLKREGSGAGAYEGAQDSMTVKKDGKPYKVAIKYGMAHWSVQAVIRQGVIVSDELLCYTPVELSSPELGTIQATERQYLSVLEHPAPIVV